MEKPIELNDAETAAVSGGLLNNIFVNVNSPYSFNTASNNTNSFQNAFNPLNSNNTTNSFNPWWSNNTI